MDRNQCPGPAGTEPDAPTLGLTLRRITCSDKRLLQKIRSFTYELDVSGAKGGSVWICLRSSGSFEAPGTLQPRVNGLGAEETFLASSMGRGLGSLEWSHGRGLSFERWVWAAASPVARHDFIKDHVLPE